MKQEKIKLPFEVAKEDFYLKLNFEEAKKYVASLKDDSRLPTIEELHQMFLAYKEGTLTGFNEESWYWSSTENTNNLSRLERFSDGTQTINNKYYSYVVRCVRDIK